MIVLDYIKTVFVSGGIELKNQNILIQANQALLLV